MNAAIEKLREQGWFTSTKRDYFAAPESVSIGPGLPKGGITEIFGPHGGGKTEFLLQVLAKHDSARIAWIGASASFYPCALASYDLDWQRFLFVEAEEEEEFVWSLLQILRSQLFDFVIVRPEELSFDERDLRRLQLATERAKSALIFLKEEPEQKSLWPLSLQLEICRKPGSLHIAAEDVIIWKGKGQDQTGSRRKRWQKRTRNLEQMEWKPGVQRISNNAVIDSTVERKRVWRIGEGNRVAVEEVLGDTAFKTIWQRSNMNPLSEKTKEGTSSKNEPASLLQAQKHKSSGESKVKVQRARRLISVQRIRAV